MISAVGRLAVRLSILIFAAAGPVAASTSGFIYVPVRPSSCGSETGCASQLLVFDGSTGAPVITVPLAIDTYPVAAVVSANGKRIYIASRALRHTDPAAITIVDSATFAILGHHLLPRQVAGSLATGANVSRLATTPDDSRVFILIGDPAGFATIVEAFDTATNQIVAATELAKGALGIAFSHVTGQVYALTGSPVVGAPHTHLTALDAATLGVIAERTWTDRHAVTLSASSDRQQLVLVLFQPGSSGGAATISSLLDPVSLADLSVHATPILGSSFATAPRAGVVKLQSTNEVLTVFEPVLQRVDMTTGAVTRQPMLSDSGAGLTISPDELRAFVVTGNRNLETIDLVSGNLRSTRALPGSGPAAATPPGAASCTYRLDSLYSSWARTGGTGSIRLSTQCAWAVTPSTAGWVHVTGPASGQGNATFGITVDEYVPPPFGQDGPRTATISIGGQVLTITQAGVNTQPPFGFFDTPADFQTGITGSLPVTGWALDDVGVARVRLFRDAVAGEPSGQIYLGEATFVESARPDVQAIFSGHPFASRAGWGYLLLTNMLPGGGTGTYRLHAYAEDIDGHTTSLGSRTITCANNTATLPFGAIDTPGQGEIVSGTITNWGWALTPQPSSIPADGSTIEVVIDGAFAGRPIYNVNRPDVAALFPGYANTTGAAGYFTFDTTTLANGVHTIAWLVRDSAGNLTAIGSRYFTVANQ